MDQQAVGELVHGKQGGDRSFHVCPALAFGVEEKLNCVDCYEDDAGVGVECHVCVGIVGDMFGDCVHPRAEEDGCWC